MPTDGKDNCIQKWPRKAQKNEIFAKGSEATELPRDLCSSAFICGSYFFFVTIGLPTDKRHSQATFKAGKEEVRE